MSMGDPDLSTPPPVVLAGDTPLTFDWKPNSWYGTRLLIALGVAAAGHLLVFYLFQVVTESSPGQAAPLQQVLVLPPGNPASQRLMEIVGDRLPALDHHPTGMEPDPADLKALVKEYVPTWYNHRPALKSLPGQAGTGPLPLLFPPPALLLPPLPEGDPDPVLPPSGPAGARPLPVLNFQSGLASRPLLQPPVWPAEVTAADWPEEGKVSFLLSLSPEGKVSSCLPLASSAGLDEEILRLPLTRMKFAPSTTSNETEWGWIDVIW